MFRCSVISAMDGSLPKKSCKTCKNKFHSGCLYKVSVSIYLEAAPLTGLVSAVVQLESLVQLPVVSIRDYSVDDAT